MARPGPERTSRPADRARLLLIGEARALAGAALGLLEAGYIVEMASEWRPSLVQGTGGAPDLILIDQLTAGSAKLDLPHGLPEGLMRGPPTLLLSRSDGSVGALRAELEGQDGLPVVPEGSLLAAVRQALRPGGRPPEDRHSAATPGPDSPSSEGEPLPRAARSEAASVALHLARLQGVVEALALATTVPEVADIILQRGVTAVDAAAGNLYVLNREKGELELVDQIGYAPELIAMAPRLPLDWPNPSCDAVKRGEPIWLSNRAEWDRHYPELAVVHAAAGYEGAASIPLLGDGHADGVIGLSFVGAHHLLAEERAFMLTLGRQAAQALERARLIAAERQARQEAEAALALLASVYATAPVGLAYFDTELRFLRINQTLAALNGASVAEHLGRPLRELVPVWAPTLEPLLRRALETGEPLLDVEISGPLIHEPERLAYTLASYYPVRDAAGTTLGVGVVVTDITARKLAEVERERLLAEAEAALRSRDAFVSIASHELKTPVTGVKASAQLLLRRLGRGSLDQATLDRLLTALVHEADRLARLVDDLLDISRIRTGHLDLDLQPVDLVALVSAAIERARDGLAAAHQLTLSSPPDLPQVPADAIRLEQVVVNLLDNAVKYSPAGGAVAVAVAAEEGGLRLSVTDEGMGWPPGAEEVIFEAFGRAANATRGHLPGMGLGLAICRSIVERHGGRIWAESQGEGRGATLAFWLPLEHAGSTRDDAR